MVGLVNYIKFILDQMEMVSWIPCTMVNRNPIWVVNRIPISKELLYSLKRLYRKGNDKRKDVWKIRLFKRQGYSVSEIISDTGIDQKTAAKYYATDGREFGRYRKEHLFRDRVFEEYEKDILEVYQIDEFGKLLNDSFRSVYSSTHVSPPFFDP